jgi:hypothetical protein
MSIEDALRASSMLSQNQGTTKPLYFPVQADGKEVPIHGAARSMVQGVTMHLIGSHFSATTKCDAYAPKIAWSVICCVPLRVQR